MLSPINICALSLFTIFIHLSSVCSPMHACITGSIYLFIQPSISSSKHPFIYKSIHQIQCWMTHECRPLTAGPCRPGKIPSRRSTRTPSPDGSNCEEDTWCSTHPSKTPCRCPACRLQYRITKGERLHTGHSHDITETSWQ